MGVTPGWADHEEFVLLELFRANLWDYIYRSTDEFAEIVHVALPGRRKHEIVAAVREVMKQFALAFNTRNFRGQKLRVDGGDVYVYEYLYETIKLLRENRTGGVWLPDELVRFLKKAKQYKQYLSRVPDTFFSRIQLWGKSVEESRNKFYALWKMYQKDKETYQVDDLDDVNAVRFKVLSELFDDVPPPSITVATTPISKAYKGMWSPDDLDVLVESLVSITLDIQKTGTSSLVYALAEKLRRTISALVTKLQDMQERFHKKTATFRAAMLPDIVYEANSDANKIFNADWNDPDDPYALGFQALRNYAKRVVSENHKKRKNFPAIPSSRKLRASVRLSADSNKKPQKTMATSVQAPPTRHNTNDDRAKNSSSRHIPVLPASSTSGETEFDLVRHVARKYSWTDEFARSVLACMARNIHLYQRNQFVEYFNAIGSVVKDVAIEYVFVQGNQILRSFEERYGSLDRFHEFALTDGKPIPIVSRMSVPRNAQEGVRSVSPSSPYRPARQNPEKSGSFIVSYPQGERAKQYTESADEHRVVLKEVGSHDDTQFEHSEANTPQTQTTPYSVRSVASNESYSGKYNFPRDSEDNCSGEEDGDFAEDGLENQSLDSLDHTSTASSSTSESRGSRSSRSMAPAYQRRDGGNRANFRVSCEKTVRKRAAINGAKGKTFCNYSATSKTHFMSTKYYADDEDDENEDDDGLDIYDDDVDSEIMSSDNEDGEYDIADSNNLPGPLQALMSSVGDRIKDLEAKNRELIERKEDRERELAKDRFTANARAKALAELSVGLRN